MAYLVAYEATASIAGPGRCVVSFRVPVSIQRRLDTIAATVEWRSVHRGALAAALLAAHTVTGTDDPDRFDRLTRTVLDYAAAGGFPAGPGVQQS